MEGLGIIIATLIAFMAQDARAGSGFFTNPVLKKLADQGLAREPKFVKIPAGEFTMGCRPGESYQCDADGRASRLHRVRITHSFELQETEVTSAQWYEVMGTSSGQYTFQCSSYFVKVFGIGICPNFPVENVTWAQIAGLNNLSFISRLNARTTDGCKYRLPTEAEWEYAARGGPDADRCPGAFGCSEGASISKEFSSGQGASEVASLPPDRLGLYDMLGNVQEWVQDYFDEYPGGLAIDPVRMDPPGHAWWKIWDYDPYYHLRVLRGGSYYTAEMQNHSPGSRTQIMSSEYNDTYVQNPTVGFRLARDCK